MIRQAFNGTTTTELHVDGGTIRMVVRSSERCRALRARPFRTTNHRGGGAPTAAAAPRPFPPDMALPSMLHTSLSLALLASGADAPAPRPLTDLMPS